MKRMIEIGVALLMSSAILFAFEDTAAVNARNVSDVPDVRQLVESSLAATQRHWQARRHYTYMERAESRRRDMDGRVKSEDIEISRTTLVDDVPFEQLVERNGQPPSPWEQRRQNSALDKLKRETPAQRDDHIREQDEEIASLVQEVPKAFDFRFMGQEAANGRTAYLLRATPHPGYQPRGTYGKVLSKVEGTVWIDRQDLVWIRLDGHITEPFSIGLFLVRLLRGSHVIIEQTRVDDRHWMPLRVEVRAAAKILLLKSVVIDRVLTYSDYRRAEAPTTPDTAVR